MRLPKSLVHRLPVALLLAGAFGCSASDDAGTPAPSDAGGSTTPDSATPVTDAGAPSADASADATVTTTDAGTDAGTPSADAGVDAGAPLVDAGPVDAGPVDAGPVDAGPPPVVPSHTMATGTWHSCAVRPGDGRVACWGQGQQMGLSRTLAGSFAEVGLTPTGSACGRRSNGLISCVGPAFDTTNGATAFPATGAFTSLRVAEDHACAIATTDRTVKCWGKNATGIAVPAGTTAHDIAVFANGGCALSLDGTTVTCWGGATANALPAGNYALLESSRNGVCALGRNGLATCSPATLAPANVAFKRLRLGPTTSCGVKLDDTLQCWSGSAAAQAAPAGAYIEVSPGAGFGGDFVCGRTLTGGYTCWGDSRISVESTVPLGDYLRPLLWGGNRLALQTTAGAVVYAGNVEATDPVRAGMPASLAPFADVTVGSQHACGLKPDGTTQCWGASFITSVPAPAGRTYSAIRAGQNGTCGIEANTRRVSCWGHTTIDGVVDTVGNAMEICTARSAVCVRRTSGAVSCNGQGLGSPNASDRFTAIGCGENVACGIKTDGTISCWGSPNNPAVVNSVPTGTFAELAVSSESACARRTNATLACWGWDPNDYGFLRPPTDLNFSRLIAGENTNCGYDTRNKLLCWGWHVRTPLEGPSIQ